jgi:hypothetical protein
MTDHFAIKVLLVGVAAAVLAALFALYQNPLFEIYLTRWGLC